MFERVTDSFRKVMAFADKEASRTHHEYIGTEHILLGILQENSGVPAQFLSQHGIDYEKVRRETDKLLPQGPNVLSLSPLPHTPRTKKVIGFAVEEARAFGHSQVGTEHLFLGLLHETYGVAAQVLMNLGLTLDSSRREILTLLGTSEHARIDDSPRRLLELLADESSLAARTLVKLGLDLPTLRAELLKISANRPGNTPP